MAARVCGTFRILGGIGLVKGDGMGQKTVRFSDLTDEIITASDGLARIVVLEHPELDDHPVEIEARVEEVASLTENAIRVAIIELHLPGEAEPQRIALDAAAFDKLATVKSMSELLAAAPSARRSTRTRTGSTPPGGDRTDYATLENAGRPHRGKATDAEKRLVREHLTDINKRLAAEGIRTINPKDPDHIERYGLAELVDLKAETAGPAK
jgi:hypothetical protein